MTIEMFRFGAKEANLINQMTQAFKKRPPSMSFTPEVMQECRRAIAAGTMVGFWFSADYEPFGICLTTIRDDGILHTRELIIYAAANLRKLSLEDWQGCFKKIKAYAQSVGCTHISFYTKVPRLFEVAALLGGDTETRYVSIPIGG